MLPLKDDLVSRSAPVMTVSIVTLNVLVFLYQTSLQLGISLEVDNPPHALETAQAFVLEFGLIPCRLMDLCAFPEDQPAPLFTIFSSMFLHAGFLHVGGNMLYLWIFGKNVEDTLGHTRFTLFYLLSGVAAALTQVLASPASEVPMIGASGAVSGVLGAYLILFPQSRVLTLVIFGFFWRLVSIPGRRRAGVLDRAPGPERTRLLRGGGERGLVRPHRGLLRGHAAAHRDAAADARPPVNVFPRTRTFCYSS